MPHADNEQLVEMRTQDSQSSMHWWWRRKAMLGSSGYTCSTPPDTSHWCLSIVHSAERDCIYIYVRFLDEHHMTSASRAPDHVIISTYMVTFPTYLPSTDQQLYGQLVGHCIPWYTECVWCMQAHFSSVRAQRQGKISEKGRETKSRNPCLLPLETFLPIFVLLLLQVEPTHKEASYLFVICSFFTKVAIDYWCPPSNPDFRSWKPLHGNSFWISRSRSKTEVETMSADGKPIHIVLECVLFKSSQKSSRTDTPARVTNFCCWLNMCSAKKCAKPKTFKISSNCS